MKVVNFLNQVSKVEPLKVQVSGFRNIELKQVAKPCLVVRFILAAMDLS